MALVVIAEAMLRSLSELPVTLIVVPVALLKLTSAAGDQGSEP